MSTNETLLLFDIDGTLLRTNGAGRQAMCNAAAQLFGEAFTFDGISFGGRLDPAIFAEAAQRNALNDHETHHHQFRDLYLNELACALGNSETGRLALPGVLDLLDTLRRRIDAGERLAIGLLSGNYQQAAPLKLAAAGIDIDWFTITAFGDEAHSRPDLVALAMQRYAATTGAPPDPKRVIVIGDTPHDIDCAAAHGCVAFAVATGPFKADELEAAGADIVVQDLADPTALLTLLSQ